MVATKNSSIAQLSDNNLIDLAITGEQKAFNALFTRHEKVVKAIAYRYLKNEQDVNEVVQDTFIRAFKALDKFRRVCKFSSWLCRIAISVAIDRFRQIQQRNKRISDIEDTIPFHTQLQSSEVDFVEQQDMAQWMQRAILTLAESDSVVIQLFYLKEQSIDEICALTGWTRANVKSKLSRARIRLRKIVEERFNGALLN